MSHPAALPVGTITIDTATTYRQTYECAAWYQEVIVAPGTYPVVAYPGSGNDRFHARLAGVKGGSDFGTRLCGRPIGSDGMDEGRGDPMEYGLYLGDSYAHTGRLVGWPFPGPQVSFDPDAVDVRVQVLNAHDTGAPLVLATVRAWSPWYPRPTT